MAISQSAYSALRIAEAHEHIDPVLNECLEDIQAETQRAGEIIRTLRRLIRRDNPQKTSVDLNAIAGQAIQLLKRDSRVLNFNIELNQGEIPRVPADRVQIAQVLVNFCLLYTSPSPRDQRGSRMPSSA